MPRAARVPQMPGSIPTAPGSETITVHILVPKTVLYDERISLADLLKETEPMAVGGLKMTLMHKRCDAHGHLHPQTEALRNGGDWLSIPDDHVHGERSE